MSGEFLAADSNRCFNLIRKVNFGEAKAHPNGLKPYQLQAPARILVVNATLGSIATEEEGHLLQFFSQLGQEYADKLEVKYIPPGSFKDFQQVLQDLAKGQDGQAPFVPNIIHFVGHSTIEEDQQLLSFIKTTSAGTEKEWISGKQFANCLEELPQLPYMVVLQLQEGSKIGDLQYNKGIPLELLSKRIPAVIGLQNPEQSWITHQFIQVVYSDFLEGADIAQAVTKGRFHLARKMELFDTRGRKLDSYGYKAFGSPFLFISTDEPLLLYEVPEALPTSEKKPLTSEPTTGTSPNTSLRGGRTHVRVDNPEHPTSPAASSAMSSSKPGDNFNKPPVAVVGMASANRTGAAGNSGMKDKRLQDLNDEVEDKLVNNHFMDAIGLLLENLSRQSQQRYQVLQQKGNLKSIRGDALNELISISQKAEKENKVRYHLLQILRTITIRDLKLNVCLLQVT